MTNLIRNEDINQMIRRGRVPTENKAEMHNNKAHDNKRILLYFCQRLIEIKSKLKMLLQGVGCRKVYAKQQPVQSVRRTQQ